MLYVAWAYDLQPLIAYVGPTRLEELGASVEDIEQQALENLKGRRVRWDTVEVPTSSGDATLVALDGDFASEQVLNPDACHELHVAMKQTPMLVAMPCRRVLFATRGNLGEPFARMVSTYARQHSDGDLLSNSVHVLDRGVISGWVPTEEVSDDVVPASEGGPSYTVSDSDRAWLERTFASPFSASMIDDPEMFSRAWTVAARQPGVMTMGDGKAIDRLILVGPKRAMIQVMVMGGFAVLYKALEPLAARLAFEIFRV